MARAAIPQGYSGESLFTVLTLRQGGEWRQGPRLELLFRVAAGAAVVLVLVGARAESAVIGCASLIRALSLAPLLEAGLLLVAGSPRAKIWEGAASWEPLPSGGVAGWAGAAASASACGALETHGFALSGNGSLPILGCGRGVEASQRLGVQSLREPWTGGRRRNHSPLAPGTRGSRRSSRRPTSLYLSAPALLWSGAEAPEHRPSPSAASSTGTGQRRWRHREVRLDP